MATIPATARSKEAGIITRMVHPDQDDWPADIAKGLLRLSLDQSDLDRFHDLVVRNQDDALTSAERNELESYLRISLLVDLIHAKALVTLKNQG